MGNKTTILYGSPGQFKVAIPKALAESIDLEKGEEVEWKIENREMLKLVRVEHDSKDK